jgi:uncharacterized membrane protein YdjX (TVP38/TMEM64 family)
LAAIVLAVWATSSYANGGVVNLLMRAADVDVSHAQVRALVESWGPLAPIGYTLAVVVEVVVAPIPGALLYAPAGVLFGGFLGGILSLLGNVLGAALCCFLGGAIGQSALSRRMDGSRLQPYVTLLRRRALWVVLLLRVNPLTSSDLVSYAAGAAGVPVWKVAAGTAIGLAPLCFAQAYLAEQLFTRLPLWLLVVSGLAAMLIVVWVLRLGTSARAH